jgi:hypothetical protein
MSGGHFNYSGYIYYQVERFADELEDELDRNWDIIDDEEYSGFGFSDEVVECLKSQVRKIREIAEIMQHIDYLYSGDHGEDTFLEIMNGRDSE